MFIVRYTDRDYPEQIQRLTAPSSLFDAMIESRTREIIDAVQSRGDGAVLEYTERFDGAKLSAEQLRISKAELVQASLKADSELRAAVALACKNVERFGQRSSRKAWSMANGQGARVGEKFDPIDRVGIYIPGGTAPLVSTSIMTVLLAKTAGCREIVVCTPPDKEGQINSALLFALSKSGATEIYRAGGAQAIAAMALGTPTVPRVKKIFGPGNAYVVAAKRLLFGYVGIDLLPGPSEVLILADDSANPGFVAADMLAQAEHGSGLERVWLLTPSQKLWKSVQKEIRQQTGRLVRSEYIERALQEQGWLIRVPNLAEAIRLTNQLAPEHCEIMTRNPREVADQITTAGAIFIGPYSPTVLGDYVAGPSHVLPTGGAGACFSGLTLDQFQRRTSLVEYSKEALRRSLSAVRKFAEVEGLDAHGNSAEIRVAKKAKSRRPTRGKNSAKSKA